MQRRLADVSLSTSLSSASVPQLTRSLVKAEGPERRWSTVGWQGERRHPPGRIDHIKRQSSGALYTLPTGPWRHHSHHQHCRDARKITSSHSF